MSFLRSDAELYTHQQVLKVVTLIAIKIVPIEIDPLKFY